MHKNKTKNKKNKNIAIIGAGPAGLYSAYLLAKNDNNLNIIVFEEHNKIGIPVKCTGLVTNSIQKIMKIPKNIIKNKIEFANIISPNNQTITIKLKDPNLVLDRAKFDQFLERKAKDSGVKIQTNHIFYRLKNNNSNTIILKNKNKNIEYRTHFLIGADGPQSMVNKLINPNTRNKFLVGIQTRIKVKIKNKNILEFYPVKQGFCWFVPESDTIARIGIACYKDQKKTFNDFIKRIESAHKIKVSKKNKIDYQAGLIPIYNSKIKTYKKINNLPIYIVGDAATQVKATTAGGIIQSLLAAQALYRSIKYNENYKKHLRQILNKDLFIHFLIRKILDNFTNKDHDYLFKLTNQKKIKKFLSKIDRDNILRLSFKMLLNEPRYLYFIKRIL